MFICLCTNDNKGALVHSTSLKSSVTYVLQVVSVVFMVVVWSSQWAMADDGPAVPEDITAEFLKDAADHIRTMQGARGASEDRSEASDPVILEEDEAAGARSSSFDAAYDGEETTSVEADSVAVGPGTEKLIPDDVPVLPMAGAQSTSPLSRLTFAAGDFGPQTGIDERLQRRASARASGGAGAGEDSTYAFVLTNEYLSEEMEAELAGLGVEVLGLHDDAIKVKLPLDQGVLAKVAQLPYVDWIGYSQPEQKVDPTLGAVRGAFAGSVEDFPIIINLFEHDATGSFAASLTDLGAVVGSYDRDLLSYRAVASEAEIAAIVDLDFVLYVEVEQPASGGHDQSMSTMGVDYIRPGGPGRRFGGASTIVGIMDTGFALPPSAPIGHVDLSKFACGRNFTDDAAGVYNDENGHGTHVLGTIVGTGTASDRYRGVATAAGNTAASRIRTAKVWGRDNTGQLLWMENAIDYMSLASACGGARPLVINISGGGRGVGLRGTDSLSRKLDNAVWSNRQSYIACGGNTGSGSSTIWTPGVAKNALTVGNALDEGFLSVGDANLSSSRGPSGDGRMKPNVMGAGTQVTSARAGTTNGYSTLQGCSMATPHVTGIAATLMEHYGAFRGRPDLLRSHLMATSLLHDDTVFPASNTGGGRNIYGLGRVSSYVSHWSRPGANGWSTRWAATTVNSRSWRFTDITVPAGTDRLVVVMSWDEPAASAGASRAVTYDLDLWVDRGADCTFDGGRQCGEWASQSNVDNTEYLIINNPPAGRYRLKMVNFRAPTFNLPVSVAANIIRGDPTPAMRLTVNSSTSSPRVGSLVTVTASVSNPSYMVSGAHLGLAGITSGLQLLNVSTRREDGVTMNFAPASLVSGGITLGNVRERDSRVATWTFRVLSAGQKFITFRAWSENGGTRNVTIALQALTS